MAFYFEAFEDRRPPDPLPHSPRREAVFHFLATISLMLGAWYIVWRWGWSLNTEALWFAVPLVMAETVAYIGMVLLLFNVWKVKDYPMQPPPESATVDVFIATYSEDPELVRVEHPRRDAYDISASAGPAGPCL